MKLVPIIVESHSGYKAGEYPICFYWMNIRFEIREISDRWYQTQITPESPLSNYFKIRTSNMSIFILKHDLETDRWFLVSPEEPVIGFFSAN